MRYVVRPEDVPTYSPPLHAGTANRRLVGNEVTGSQAVEVVLGVVEPGGVAERHSHTVEQAMYILVIYAPPLERSGTAQPFKPA